MPARSNLIDRSVTTPSRIASTSTHGDAKPSSYAWGTAATCTDRAQRDEAVLNRQAQRHLVELHGRATAGMTRTLIHRLVAAEHRLLALKQRQPEELEELLLRDLKDEQWSGR
jgi:hypothetical protein